MCGIVGFVAGNNYQAGTKRRDFLMQALFVDTLRGEGGTGLALTAKKDGEIGIFKRALAGPDYLRSQVWELATARLPESRVVIGHNRAATIGSVRDKNCHPFYYKNVQEIVLVHNGTLSNHHSLTPAAFTHDVDSAHAAFALASTDNEMDVLKKVLGPFVFVWFNKTKNTFNIARNSFRDISYGVSDEGDMFFASEWLMMDFLMYRNGISLKSKDYREIAEDTWMEWGFNEDGTLKKPAVRKIKYEAPPAPVRPPVPAWTGARQKDPVLDDLGLERDEEVYVCIDGWQKHHYNAENDPYGRILGRLTYSDPSKKSLKVEINSARQSEYLEWMSVYKDCFPAVVVGVLRGAVSKDSPRGDVVVQLRPNRKLLEEWARPSKTAQRDDEPEFIKGPEGLISRAKWETMTKGGCAWCTNDISNSNPDELTWIPGCTPAAALCKECGSDAEVLEMILETKEAGKAIVKAVN